MQYNNNYSGESLQSEKEMFTRCFENLAVGYFSVKYTTAYYNYRLTLFNPVNVFIIVLIHHRKMEEILYNIKKKSL